MKALSPAYSGPSWLASVIGAGFVWRGREAEGVSVGPRQNRMDEIYDLDRDGTGSAASPADPECRTRVPH